MGSGDTVGTYGRIYDKLTSRVYEVSLQGPLAGAYKNIIIILSTTIMRRFFYRIAE
jgi:hypothetical protein